MICFLFDIKQYGFRGKPDNIDALFDYMMSMEMNKIKNQLTDEEYDTDAVGIWI